MTLSEYFGPYNSTALSMSNHASLCKCCSIPLYCCRWDASPGYSSSSQEHAQDGAAMGAGDAGVHPLLRMTQMGSPAASPMDLLSKSPQVKDLPTQGQRAARSRKLDVLGGEKPPPDLFPLLCCQGYLHAVLPPFCTLCPPVLCAKVMTHGLIFPAADSI